MQKIRPFLIKLLIALWGVVLLASISAPALADFGPPPPNVFWFYLDDQTGAAPHLRGAQIVCCEDPACAKPVLFQAYGSCHDPECLPGQVKLNIGNDLITFFTCDDQSCYSACFERQYSCPHFRLVLQYSDRARTLLGTPAQSGKQFGGGASAWQVTVRPDNLQLSPTAVRPQPASPQPTFFQGLGITLAVELPVAGLLLLLGFPLLRRKKTDGGEPASPAAQAGEAAAPEGPSFGEMLAALGILLLVNLVSYPAVWFFFPALRGYVGRNEWSGVVILLVFTWVWAAAFGILFNVKSTIVRILMAAGIGLLLVYGIPYFFIAFTFGFSPYLSIYQFAPGLRPPAILLSAELYAFVVEALLIFWYSRRRIPLPGVLAISLAMNLASFAVSLVW